MAEDRKGGLVVPDRPQISVELVNGTDIVITTSAIGPGFDNVETTELVIPADCGKQVARAILDLLKR